MINVYVVIETAYTEGTDGNEKDYRVKKVFFNKQVALDYIDNITYNRYNYPELWYNSVLFIEERVIE